MGRYSNAPVPYTCPAIDGVKNRLDDIIKEVENCKDEIEELRDANDRLRRWGDEECERANDLEKENDRLSEELRVANDTIEELRHELSLQEATQ